MIRRDCSIFTKPPCDNKTSLPVKNEFSHTWGDLVYVLNHAGHTIDIKFGLNTRPLRMLKNLISHKSFFIEAFLVKMNIVAKFQIVAHVLMVAQTQTQFNKKV